MVIKSWGRNLKFTQIYLKKVVKNWTYMLSRIDISIFDVLLNREVHVGVKNSGVAHLSLLIEGMKFIISALLLKILIPDITFTFKMTRSSFFCVGSYVLNSYYSIYLTEWIQSLIDDNKKPSFKYSLNIVNNVEFILMSREYDCALKPYWIHGTTDDKVYSR